MSRKPKLSSRRRLLEAIVATPAITAWRALKHPLSRTPYLPLGLLPLVSEAKSTNEPLSSLGKAELRLLNDRPINAETPAHLLDDSVTPAHRLFVRNNGIPPQPAKDPDQWEVRIHGEACSNPQTFTLKELKEKFASVKLQLQLECGGNGRSEFRPRASGNQWTTGAVACPEWTGVRLSDVLNHCGIDKQAVYVAYRSADSHLSGDQTKEPISRGVPVAKAMESESLLAYEMNGEAIPQIHGAPLRMVIGGWPGSASGKWVTEILVRDRVHDGAKMLGNSYRVPCAPVAPNSSVAPEDMCIIESMPVKSLITFPQSGIQVAAGKTLDIRGHAWAGDLAVREVELSTDFGMQWHTAKVHKPSNRLAWQRFEGTVKFDKPGYHEIWAKATDAQGLSQPMIVPGWNPKGYLNNACHRIAVQVS